MLFHAGTITLCMVVLSETGWNILEDFRSFLLKRKGLWI